MRVINLLNGDPKPLNYDNGGNVVGDGVNTYVWNARDQLVGISGLVGASFQYDGLGRRIRNASGNSVLFDGANSVQELSGSTVVANSLLGATDELFLWANQSGSSSAVLRDAQNSTIALVDSSGLIQTQYTFDPFGNTTVGGTASTLGNQYTGRENDGTGLYYNRARYYAPALHRFVSEDPHGGGVGRSKYLYVDDDPVNVTDPTGLYGRVVGGAAGLGVSVSTKWGSRYGEGLVESVTAKIVHDEDDTGERIKTDPRGNKEWFDQKGHVIGKQLGGGDWDHNRFWQNASINNSEQRKFENWVRRWVDTKDSEKDDECSCKYNYSASVTVELVYGDASNPLRPSLIILHAFILHNGAFVDKRDDGSFPNF
jgi:RHS repeat-associated protein